MYTSWGNTLLKAKTRQVLISCASPWLIQQEVGLTQWNYQLSQKLTVPNKGKGKRQHTYSLETIFYLQRFSFLIWVKKTREINSQYPSANDLVQQLLAEATTWCHPWLHHAPCNTFGIKRKPTSVKNLHQCMLHWSIFMITTCYAHLISMTRISKTSDINV